jgi:exosome complex component RRP4
MTGEKMEKETMEKETNADANDKVRPAHNESSKIVVPGEILKESMDILPGFGTFREGKNIISKMMGVSRTDGRVISVTPLSGVYIPQGGDYVIGEVTGINFSNWSVDIAGPYEAYLTITEDKSYIERDADLSRFHAIGELIFAKVNDVSKTKYIYLTMRDPKTRKLSGGVVGELTPSKVPRLIGKAGSMINLIKDRTNCLISVGQNGRVWVKGEHEKLALEAINMVEKYSHTTGLTDKITEMFNKELGKPKERQGP